eukprot:jgi/Picsp_1/873/NSC_04361-R1_atp-dependent rna helicase ddx23
MERKKEPLSLEELMKKKEEEKAKESRPVFLTKQQRQELALQRRKEEVEQQKKRRLEAIERAEEDGSKGVRDNLGNGGDGRYSSYANGAGQKERGRGYAAGNSNYNNGSSRRRGGREEDERVIREKELELIKQQYLGTEKKKRKILKAADRFKFHFDWDAAEDTSRDLNPLYDKTHEATLLFGRGMRAGIDRREQRRAAAAVETQAIRKARQLEGNMESREEVAKALERAKRADVYGSRDMVVETHWSEKARDAMTERDWRIFREDFNISFRGAMSGAALPIRDWEEANLPSVLQRSIADAGYKKPSPIQMASIPLGIQQRDVIGVAETGSGKTAAFVIPMIMYIQRQPVMAGNPDIEAEGPYSVVLAPTRELAQQIEVETKKIAKYTGYRVVSIVGGQSIEDQGFALRKGCEIVVATPGRLVDCIERQYAVLNQCNYVVLDEADRMIDLGFEPQVMSVLDAMPSSNLKPENEDERLEENKVYRTTYMFSATMPPAVERLARKYLRRPVIVTIGRAGKATDNITQRVLVMKENEKQNALEKKLYDIGEAKVIVFANTHRKCEVVTKQVEAMGFFATMLHGGKSQEQREESIRGFRQGKYNILVATDVAGRGIDVPDVMLVVNYDMPHTIEAYTHRIGRTGRAGRKGDALTFLTMGDTEVFYDLKKFLEDNNCSIPRQLSSHEAARHKPGSVNAPKPSVQYARK